MTTEQEQPTVPTVTVEWGVLFPNGTVNDHPSRNSAMIEIGDYGGRLVSRSVTPWSTDERVRKALVEAEPASPADPIGDAVNTVWLYRHHLPTDALRTLADAWSCASAAHHGEPYEPFWQFDEEDDFYATHDTEECERENGEQEQPR